MTLDQHALHAFIRNSHIAVGAVSLVIFWLPIFAKKGGPLHIRSGRLFVGCAYYVSATAAVSCTWALIDPLGFTGITRELTTAEMEHLSGGVRFLFAILGTLMTWLVAGLQMGLHVVRNKMEPNVHSGFVRFCWWVAGTCSAALALFGFWHLKSAAPNYLVPVLLGIVGVLDARKQVVYLRTPPTPNSWFYTHIECMLGAGIALYTAFSVFGFSRIVPFKLPGALGLIPWILPAMVGMTAISLLTRHYKKKLGQAPGDVATIAN